MQSSNGAKQSGIVSEVSKVRSGQNRWGNKLIWIIVAALVGAAITVLRMYIFKERYEVTVWRVEYYADDPAEANLRIKNSGDITLKNIRMEFHITLDAEKGVNPILEERLWSSGRSCSAVDRYLYDKGAWPKYVAEYDCKILNPGEVMYYDVKFDKWKV